MTDKSAYNFLTSAKAQGLPPVPWDERKRCRVLDTRQVICPWIPSLMYRHHRRCPGAARRRLAPEISAAIAMLEDTGKERRLGDYGYDT